MNQSSLFGRLMIKYPNLQGKCIDLGGESVHITFQKESLPKIYEVRPAKGAVFAVEKPVYFGVKTLSGAAVIWDFGDGGSESGSDVHHAFHKPGAYQVKVSACLDPRVGTSTEALSLEIVDAGVNVDPLPDPIITGEPASLTCTGHGNIRRYEWIVDGKKYDGEERKDGRQGSRLDFPFKSEGKHSLYVVCYLETAEPVQSDEQTPEVIDPKIVTAGESPFSWRDASERGIQFHLLQCPRGWKGLAWDFDDGRNDNAESNHPSPLHKYDRHGAYNVKVVVTGKDGKVVTRSKTVNIVCDKPECRVENWPDRVRVGTTILLQDKDKSRGDISQRTWYYDGKELPAEQESIIAEPCGMHVVRLEIKGPAARNGTVETSTGVQIEFRVIPPHNHFLFVLASLFGLTALLIGLKFTTRNGPRGWKLYYSNIGRPTPDDPYVRLSRGWHWWRKLAAIPMSHIYSGCDYWTSGPGKWETIRVAPFKSGKQWAGALNFSGEDSHDPGVLSLTGGVCEGYVAWKDQRCPDKDFQPLHVLLVMDSEGGLGGCFLMVCIVTAVSAFLAWAFRTIYLDIH